jgi:hypothetical protein
MHDSLFVSSFCPACQGATFIGAADWSACRKEVSETLMEKDTFCRTQPCAIGGMYQPPVPASTDIYAASSYFTTAQVGIRGIIFCIGFCAWILQFPMEYRFT